MGPLVGHVSTQCDMRMKRLRHHLRTLLVVKSWSGERMLFRYYDPRVLRAYLPTCTSDELRTVFGPVPQYYTRVKPPRS
jgi:hypothetical protein